MNRNLSAASGRNFRNRSLRDLTAWMLRRCYGLSTARLRSLPDFLIIGAQRCGTTSLFKYLSQHPDVYPSFPKEIHFFTNNYQRGLNWYRSHFPIVQNNKKKTGRANKEYITGEATPYYLAHPHAARRIKTTVPDARLIVLLRNPVERAYSHYHHEVRMGVEPLSFEAAIQAEEVRLDKELERMLEDESYRSFNHQHYSYLSRGIYADQIQCWMDYFAPESILILNSDHLSSNPSGTVRQVTDFLELRNWDRIDYRKYHAAPYPQMGTATREKLLAYFRPYNQKLCDLINIKLDLEA
jgi:hypothetical protein